MKDIIRMNQLAGTITEGQAKKMIAILNENKNVTKSHLNEASESKKLFDFPEGEGSQDHLNYEKLGYTVVMDDPANDILSAELDLTKYDWMAVLSSLEDAAYYKLYPSLEYNGKIYGYKEALALADEKAAGDTYNNKGIGASSGKF